MIHKKKASLLAECAFYGAEHIAAMIRGQIIPLHLRPEDRSIRAQEIMALESDDPSELLLDAFATEFKQKPSIELQLPLLFPEQKPFTLSGSLQAFHEYLDRFSGGLLSDLAGIPSLIIAGGAVLSAFIGGKAGDLDIFLTCPVTEGEETMKLVFEAVQRNQAREAGLACHLLVARSNSAITFFRRTGAPIQVVLHVYKSIGQLLGSFDVDCCAIAYEPSTHKVWCTRSLP
jgi:hypothetical protein